MNTPKGCFLALTVSLLVALDATLPAAPPRQPQPQAHKNEITKIDALGGTVMISNERGETKIYRVGAGTQILINGQHATIKDLALGMVVQVNTSEPGVAGRIVVDATGASVVKAAPASSRVRVPANTAPEHPVVVGAVKAGQVVTVVPIKVWWCGGGSKAGVFCDWNGYQGRGSKTMPWMVLVAAVGKDTFVPTDNALTFTVPADGTLALYPNDERPEDNVGSGDVTVTVADK
jgi:hypothetical protein